MTASCSSHANRRRGGADDGGHGTLAAPTVAAHSRAGSSRGEARRQVRRGHGQYAGTTHRTRNAARNPGAQTISRERWVPSLVLTGCSPRAFGMGVRDGLAPGFPAVATHAPRPRAAGAGCASSTGSTRRTSKISVHAAGPYGRHTVHGLHQLLLGDSREPSRHVAREQARHADQSARRGQAGHPSAVESRAVTTAGALAWPGAGGVAAPHSPGFIRESRCPTRSVTTRWIDRGQRHPVRGFASEYGDSRTA